MAVQVWRSVDTFRGESSVPTWLYRVALNTTGDKDNRWR
jgi:DNA-directed RNA polymerase specialized sigma24 family protein